MDKRIDERTRREERGKLRAERKGLQVAGSSGGEREGKLRQISTLKEHQTEIKLQKPKHKFVSTLLSNFPFSLGDNWTNRSSPPWRKEQMFDKRRGAQFNTMLDISPMGLGYCCGLFTT